MPNSPHFQSEIKQTFVHPTAILSQNTRGAEEQHLGEDQHQLSFSVAPTQHTSPPPRTSNPRKLTKEMRQALIDRRVNGEEYDAMPFFTSITESVSCSSEEAAHQGIWSAARDTGKRSSGGIFSRRRQQQKLEIRDDYDEEENEIEFVYSQTDEERDSIWATDGRDESVEVFTPFSLPSNMRHFNKQSIPHPKSTGSRSLETTSTWMHETTFGSSSLLDDDESMSTAPSPSSSAASSSMGTNKSVFDDEQTYDENETSYREEDYLRFNHPVESFLDEMAENKSIRRIGNYFLSKTCFAEQACDDDDDDDNSHYDDDDDEEDDGDDYTLQPGRSRSSRKQQPPHGIKLLFSLASSADTILEAQTNEQSIWGRLFQCSGARK